MNTIATIDASGFARDPIADAIATLDFEPWPIEQNCRSGGIDPERYLAQLLAATRIDLNANAPDVSLPKPTGEVWTDHAELLAAVRAAKRSPERYLADANRLLDFAAHVAAIESRAAREGEAGDAALAAFIAERRAGGADPLAVFVAVRHRAGVPADESLRRVFLSARERCERVREFVPASGPIPAEPGAGSINAGAPTEPPEPIVDAINALREWIASADTMLRRRSGGGPTRTPPNVVPWSVVEAEFDVSDRTIRRLIEARELTDHRPAGHAANAGLLIDRDELAALGRYPRRPDADRRLAALGHRPPE